MSPNVTAVKCFAAHSTSIFGFPKAAVPFLFNEKYIFHEEVEQLIEDVWLLLEYPSFN